MGTWLLWLVLIAGMGARQRQDIYTDLRYWVIQIAATKAGARACCDIDNLSSGGGEVTTQYHNSVLGGEAGVVSPAQYRYDQMEIVGGDI